MATNGHTLTMQRNLRAIVGGDDFFKAKKTDRFNIRTHEPGVLRAWAKQLGVSEDRMRTAVEKVGPSVADVNRYLRK